ncbi:MAG TPA: sugar transferase [Desulfobacteraceae bacterium]|nr:sugar transferase [Desulfobacteraceae bacterium]
MQKIFYRLTLTGFYVFLDCVCIFGSVFAAYGIYHLLGMGKGVAYDARALVPFTLALAGIGCGSMALCGAYRRESGILNVVEVRGVILGVLLCFAVTNAFFFVIRFAPSRYVTVMAFGFMIVLLPLTRSILYAGLEGRIPDALSRRILIYGAGRLGQRLFREIHNSPRQFIRVCGFIDDDSEKLGMCVAPSGFQANDNCRVLGGRADIERLVHENRIEGIYVAISDIDNTAIRKLGEQCSRLGIDLAFVPGLHEVFTHRVKLEQVGNLPLVREHQFRWSLWDELGKRTMDLMLALGLGVVLFPIMAAVAAAVKLDSPGPALFRQKRVGKNGKIFHIYKFRTMVNDAPPYAVNPLDHNDPRITRVGRFLRRTSFDELPQILNVLRGEMSFVGPRPEMPFIVEQYDDIHRERLHVLPGITGLWQLSGDRSKPIHENMDYDLYYIYNRSFFMDVTILLQTIIFAFRGI